MPTHTRVPLECAPFVHAGQRRGVMWGAAFGAALVLVACILAWWLSPPVVTVLTLVHAGPARRTCTLHPQSHVPWGVHWAMAHAAAEAAEEEAADPVSEAVVTVSEAADDANGPTFMLTRPPARARLSRSLPLLRPTHPRVARPARAATMTATAMTVAGGTAEALAQAAVAATAAAGYVLVPAVYSDVDEGFVIRLRVGADNVLAVLDSGSGNLSVGTADCVKQALCSAHDGAYRPGASPHARDLGEAAVLHFASLAIDAQWWSDAVALPFVWPTACALGGGGGVSGGGVGGGAGGRGAGGAGGGSVNRLPPALEDVHDEVPLRHPLRVAAAARMDGTASNILGLMSVDAAAATRTSPGAATGTGHVLDDILAALALPCRSWSLVAYPSGAGFLVLGEFPRACFPDVNLRYVPLSTTFDYMGAPCVDVHGVRWRHAPPNGTPSAWTVAPAGTFPRHAVLDTGTACSYATHHAAGFAALAGLPGAHATVRARDVDALPELELELVGGVRIVYGPRFYMRTVRGSDGGSGGSDSGGGSGSAPSAAARALFATDAPMHTTLLWDDPSVNALFGPGTSVMLVGVHHLAAGGSVVSVDLDARRVGWARMT